MRRAQDRARGAFRVIAGDHRRRGRPPQRRGVFGIAERREVAGAGVLDSGDLVDLDVAVPFKTTGEPLSDVAQLQEPEYTTGAESNRQLPKDYAVRTVIRSKNLT